MSYQGPYLPNFGRPSRHQLARRHRRHGGGIDPNQHKEFNIMDSQSFGLNSQMPQQHGGYHGGHNGHGIGSKFLC